MIKKLAAYLSIEMTTNLLVKVGILILLVMTGIILNDLISSSLELKQKASDYHQTTENKAMILLQYISLSDTEPLQVRPLVTELEKEFGSSINYFRKQTSQLTQADQPIQVSDDYELKINGISYLAPLTIEINTNLLQFANITNDEAVMEKFAAAEEGAEAIPPVLLGSDYVGSFEIGDLITLADFSEISDKNGEYFGKEKQTAYQVAGFLPKGQKLPDYQDLGSEPILLDKWLLLPLLAERQQSNDPTITDLTSYFFLLNDSQLAQLSPRALVSRLRPIAEGYGFEGLTLQNIAATPTFSLSDMQRQFQENIIKLTIFSALVILQLVVLFQLINEKSRETYQLLYTLGSTRKELFLSSQILYLIIAVLAVLITFLSNEFYFHRSWIGGAFFIGSGSLIIVFLLCVFIANRQLLGKVGAHREKNFD